MRRFVLPAFFLLIAAPATAQDLNMIFGCFAAADTEQVFKLPLDKRVEKMAALAAEGKCVMAAFTPSDWERGTVIGTIRAVQAHPYRGMDPTEATTALILGKRPPVEILYFSNSRSGQDT